MAKKVYQLKISLQWIKPMIWRRVLVEPTITLLDLHDVIQCAMGWSNSHLHIFMSPEGMYAPKSMGFEGTKPSNNVKLNTILKEPKDVLMYEYDLGDSWLHKIVLEKVVEAKDGMKIPRCTGGKRSAPPEDCGGVGGYYDLLEALSDENHVEHEDMVEWVGEDFDPEHFDLKDVNELFD